MPKLVMNVVDFTTEGHRAQKLSGAKRANPKLEQFGVSQGGLSVE